jgi:predicted GIY-YIG superfamily endonuclease
MHPTYLKMLERLMDDGGTEWSVYVVHCADGSLYTGIAKDVHARLAKHNSGGGGAYTRTHRPVTLLYQERGLSRAAALRREAAIKRLSRPRKEQLVHL